MRGSTAGACSVTIGALTAGAVVLKFYDLVGFMPQTLAVIPSAL
jgi:hypothetical protein